MNLSAAEDERQVVLTIWVEGIESIDALEAELRMLGCESFQCRSVIDDGVVDVVVDAPSEVAAYAIRDDLSRRLEEGGSRMIRSWVFSV